MIQRLNDILKLGYFRVSGAKRLRRAGAANECQSVVQIKICPDLYGPDLYRPDLYGPDLYILGLYVDRCDST